MSVLARFVIAHRRWVLLAWLLLAVAGGYAAPKATSALSYDFGLPGQHGYEANQQVVQQFGSGGDNAPAKPRRMVLRAQEPDSQSAVPPAEYPIRARGSNSDRPSRRASRSLERLARM